MEGTIPARCERMTEKKWGPCILFNFPSFLRNLRRLPFLLLPLHYHHIIFLKLAHARGCLLPFCSNFLPHFPLSWLVLHLLTDIFPLTANCEHRPHPLYQGFCFYSEMASDWRQAVCPEAAFLAHRLGSHLLDRRNLSHSEAPPNPCPENTEQ